jgi:hypothetical protein
MRNEAFYETLRGLKERLQGMVKSGPKKSCCGFKAGPSLSGIQYRKLHCGEERIKQVCYTFKNKIVHICGLVVRVPGC